MAATDPHITPKPVEPDDPEALAEYDLNGRTFQMTASYAERFGAKKVDKPANKAVSPDNK